MSGGKDKWEHYTSPLMSFTFEGYRLGWRGLWDHAKEIILRREPLLMHHTKTASVSFWFKSKECTVDDIMFNVSRGSHGER